MIKKYSLTRAMSEYVMLRSERSEWEAEWKEISMYLLPGRGIYSLSSVPRKRRLTSEKAINTVGRRALRVLTAGLQAGLTSPSRPWLEYEWKDKRLKQIQFLKDWLYEAKLITESALQSTNFYPTIHSFYTEYAGFGTGSIFIDSTTEDAPFGCNILTAGEYVFATDFRGRANKMYRMIFRSPTQLVEEFGEDKVSESVRDIIKNKSAIASKVYIPVLEATLPEKYQDKPFTQIRWELAGSPGSFSDTGLLNSVGSGDSKPLSIRGFYEFPAPVGRWDTIGQDIYGLGPGSEALPEIKRLQEMEKAFRMATHKDINPPLSAPAYMKGFLDALPGAYNYYRNPGDKVESLYNAKFNYQGVMEAIDRLEMNIKEIFFNDIFLTASRNPNASPMKAAEVHVKDSEKNTRLGPSIERIQPEFIIPTIERIFNILLRKGYFPELPPEYADMVGEFEINIVSPLAQAQKLVASQSIQTVLAFAGQAAQIKPEVMDKFNIDASVDEFVDAHGAPRRIMNTEEQVAKIRSDRQKAIAAQQKQEQEAQQQAMGSQMGAADAQTQKTMAEAGQIMTESLVDQQALGGLM
jgi:hypothetical protein